MNIYATPGSKVRYIEQSPTTAQIRWGSNTDPNILTVGSIYTVERTEVHSYHTKLFLKEFPGKHFNTVWFEDMLETCCICNERTGRAGKHDDSLYGDKGDGPYCEKCFIWKYGQSTMSNKESEVKDDR